MSRCLVALGSNLGDRASLVRRAIQRIATQPAIRSIAASSLVETQSVGGTPGQHNFLNAAVAFDTELSPEALHALLQQIERDLGRQRHERWSARTIDLDLLLYGDRVIETPELIVPHPRMAFRRFVVDPAAEVAPDMVHPLIGWSLARLLEHLHKAVPYVALLGMPGSGKTALARQVATAMASRYVADPASGPVQENSATGDASPAYAREVELLKQRARVLNRAHWPELGAPAVSDFYFDQCLAYAETKLSAAEMQAFRREFEQQAAQVVLPKLLVVLDTRPSAAASTSEAAGAFGDETLRGCLLALAARPGLGPVLYVGRDAPEAQFTEIAAAIQAMQPRPLDV